MESLADDAENASQTGNIRDMYSIIRKISGRFIKPKRPVKDKDGKHFEDLLKRPEPPDIQPATEDIPMDCDPPTKDEIRKAIIQLKNGKSAGPDGIPAQALKANITVSVEMLHPLFQKIWKEEDIPAQWKEGYGTAKKKRLSYLVGNLVATNRLIEKALHAIGYNQIPTK